MNLSRLLTRLVYLLERESARSPYVCHRTDGRTDGQATGQVERGTRLLARPGKDEGWDRAVGAEMGGAERLRRNYLLSCVFIFRVITNEVNRNRTKLILLSVEKSHRRLSVHPRPRSFRPRLTATRCDATRVCHSYTACIVRQCAAFSTLVKRTGRTAH